MRRFCLRPAGALAHVLSSSHSWFFVCAFKCVVSYHAELLCVCGNECQDGKRGVSACVRACERSRLRACKWKSEDPPSFHQSMSCSTAVCGLSSADATSLQYTARSPLRASLDAFFQPLWLAHETKIAAFVSTPSLASSIRARGLRRRSVNNVCALNWVCMRSRLARAD